MSGKPSRFLPQSLSGRLLLAAAIFTTLALVAATIIIGLILQRFITSEVDQQLDRVISSLSEAIEAGPDGAVRLSRLRDGPPFDRFGSGWYWQVTGAGPMSRSVSLGSGSISAPPNPIDWHSLLSGRTPSSEIETSVGQSLHVRQAAIAVNGKSIEIVVTAPRAAISGPLREAIIPLVASLCAMAAVLASASFLQVRLGLQPLRTMLASVRKIRAGTDTHIPVDQPTELRPLALELNGLIDQNREQLARARLHVANLAHGLKTPLANLELVVREERPDGRRMASELIGQMNDRIRHHLGRARAGNLGKIANQSVRFQSHIDDISAVLCRIHADRPVTLHSKVEPALTVPCEAQDLDEMLGNLLDNAFKWARSRIDLDARRQGGMIVILVMDDGPGLPADRLEAALAPGLRLDQTVPGDGFGLSIVRELAELYGGFLHIETPNGHGLQVSLNLPASGPA